MKNKNSLTKSRTDDKMIQNKNKRGKEMNTFKKIICLVLAVCALGLVTISCDNSEEKVDKAFYDYNNSKTGSGTEFMTMFVKREIDSMKVEDFEPSSKQSDFVLIKVKNYGDIVVLLRSDVAPITVANFKKLVADGFYNETVFHRVIDGFMIQGGGCYFVENEDGKGETLKEKESPTITGEFTNNGVENNLYHIRGVISMARVGGLNNSASSQFFIIHESGYSSSKLNGDYASFGYVLAGMDVVDAIATCRVFGPSESPMPIDNVVIESITFVEPIKNVEW